MTSNHGCRAVGGGYFRNRQGQRARQRHPRAVVGVAERASATVLTSRYHQIGFNRVLLLIYCIRLLRCTDYPESSAYLLDRVGAYSTSSERTWLRCLFSPLVKDYQKTRIKIDKRLSRAAVESAIPPRTSGSIHVIGAPVSFDADLLGVRAVLSEY